MSLNGLTLDIFLLNAPFNIYSFQ